MLPLVGLVVVLFSLTPTTIVAPAGTAVGVVMENVEVEEFVARPSVTTGGPKPIMMPFVLPAEGKTMAWVTVVLPTRYLYCEAPAIALPVPKSEVRGCQLASRVGPVASLKPTI